MMKAVQLVTFSVSQQVDNNVNVHLGEKCDNYTVWLLMYSY